MYAQVKVFTLDVVYPITLYPMQLFRYYKPVNVQSIGVYLFTFCHYKRIGYPL